MGLKARVAILFLVLACLAPSVARADRAAALADFNQGKQYQATRQWRLAIQCYAASLKADPSFYYSYKALGTVYYQAGDHRGALAYYDLYLQSAPTDSATRAFAGRIRAELGRARPPQAAAAAAANPISSAPERQKLAGGFGVSAFGGAAFAGGDDISSDFAGFNPPPGQDIKAGPCIASFGGLEVDYALDLGPAIGLAVLAGPDRNNPLTASPGFSGNAVVTSMGCMVTPAWRFIAMRNFVLEPRIGIGFVSENIQFTSDSGNSDTYYGSGYAVWPQLRAEYVMSNWGIGADLGYFTSSVATITDSTTGKPFLKVDGSNMSVDTAGPTLGVFVTYHLNELLH